MGVGDMKYLDKVSDEDLIEFLKQNKIYPGIFFDEKGNILPVVERDERAVFFRGKLKESEIKTKTGEVMQKYLKSILEYLKTSQLDLNDCFVIFDDFSASPDYFSNEDFRVDIQNKYANFMYDKFGEQYREEYNAEILKRLNPEELEQE